MKLENPSKKQFTKSALSYDEQLALLESRGLEIDMPRQEVFSLLNHINYYHLEAYWFPFYERGVDCHKFKPSIKFSRIWELYRIDRNLRELFSHALEHIEISLKTKFAYTLAHEFGSHPLERINFPDCDDAIYNDSYVLLCEGVKKSQDQFILHYKKKYIEQLPPIWVSVEIITLGQISVWYKSILPDRLKKEISKEYGILSTDVMSSWIQHLTYIRNICAHHLRLWNRNLTILPANYARISDISENWIHQDDHDRFSYKKLYNTLLIVDYLWQQICPNDSEKWRFKLMYLIDSYNIQPRDMGFPLYWSSKPYWSNR